MDKQVLEAYLLIGKANDLTHVKDNIFTNTNGIRFYLDQYGFHTVNQYYSTKLLRVLQRGKTLLAAIANLSQIDVVGKKSRKAIRKILLTNNLNATDKIKLTLDYLDATTDSIESYHAEIDNLFNIYLQNK